MGEQLDFSAIAGYAIPHLISDGAFANAGTLAIKESLSIGSLEGVMDVLDEMHPKAMVSALLETGFSVSPGVAEKGRDAVLESVQHDLIDAIRMRVDGFGLREARTQNALAAEATGQLFWGPSAGSTNYGPVEFEGDHQAMMAIQDILRTDSVVVDLFGDATAGERASLLFIASQAIENGLQGFGFDGVPGKYEVPLSMAEVADLHKHATRAVAVESVKHSLGVWASGSKVGEVSEWVPDSIQRLLHGSLSASKVTAVINAVEGDLVGRHAGEMGAHVFGRLLAEQGFDVNAATVDVQARDHGLQLVNPDVSRGQYVGPVVGLDHRAALIKFSRDKAVALAFKDLAEGQSRPGMGDTVRMKFKAGELTVSMADRAVREEVGR